MLHAHEMQYEPFTGDDIKEVSIQIVVPASTKRKKSMTSCIIALKISFGTLAILVLSQIIYALGKLNFQSIIEDLRKEVYWLNSEVSLFDQPQDSVEAYSHPEIDYNSYALFEDDGITFDDFTKKWINSHESNNDDYYYVKERSYFNDYYYPRDDDRDGPSAPITVWVLEDEKDDSNSSDEIEKVVETTISNDEQKEIEHLCNVIT